MARKKNKALTIELTPYYKVLQRVRKPVARSGQTFKDRKKEANKKKCRKRVDY